MPFRQNLMVAGRGEEWRGEERRGVRIISSVGMLFTRRNTHIQPPLFCDQYLNDKSPGSFVLSVFFEQKQELLFLISTANHSFYSFLFHPTQYL